MSIDAWQEAFDADTAQIEAHPMFTKLVREVAIAEQPNMRGSSWLRRNSRTYGSWITRSMPYVDTKRRARQLTHKIAVELWGDLDDSRSRERDAKVYVTARNLVTARLARPR